MYAADLSAEDAQLREKAQETIEGLLSSLTISDDSEEAKNISKDDLRRQHVQRLENCIKDFDTVLAADTGSCGTMSFSGIDAEVTLGRHDTPPLGCDHKLSEVIVNRGYCVKVFCVIGLDQEKCVTFSSGTHKISEEAVLRVGAYEGETDVLESHEMLQDQIRARINLLQLLHSVKCLEGKIVDAIDEELNQEDIVKVTENESLTLQLKPSIPCDEIILEALHLVHKNTRQWVNKAVLQKLAQSQIVSSEAKHIINETKVNELKMKCTMFLQMLNIMGKGTVFHMAMELYFLCRCIALKNAATRGEVNTMNTRDPLIMMELYGTSLISRVCKFIDENETIQRSSYSSCKPECALTTDCANGWPPKRADLLIKEETLVTIYDWKFPRFPWTDKKIDDAEKTIKEYLAIAEEMYPNCTCVGYLVVFPVDHDVTQTHKVQLENGESRTILIGRQKNNKRPKSG